MDPRSLTTRPPPPLVESGGAKVKEAKVSLPGMIVEVRRLKKRRLKKRYSSACDKNQGVEVTEAKVVQPVIRVQDGG